MLASRRSWSPPLSLATGWSSGAGSIRRRPGCKSPGVARIPDENVLSLYDEGVEHARGNGRRAHTGRVGAGRPAESGRRPSWPGMSSPSPAGTTSGWTGPSTATHACLRTRGSGAEERRGTRWADGPRRSGRRGGVRGAGPGRTVIACPPVGPAVRLPPGTVTAGLHAGMAACEWHLHRVGPGLCSWPHVRCLRNPAALYAAAGACIAAAEGGVKGRVAATLVPVGARLRPWEAILRRSGRAPGPED